MADPYLAALVDAVEAGAVSPPIWMTLKSGDLVTGVPRPSRDFASGTQAALQRGYYAGKSPLPTKTKKGPERSTAASEQATADIKLFDVGLDGSSNRQAMTLANVRVLFGGRTDGANIPVVRVSLDAISLWWIAGEEEFKGGSGFFLGVAVPV